MLNGKKIYVELISFKKNEILYLGSSENLTVMLGSVLMPIIKRDFTTPI